MLLSTAAAAFSDRLRYYPVGRLRVPREDPETPSMGAPPPLLGVLRPNLQVRPEQGISADTDLFDAVGIARFAPSLKPLGEFHGYKAKDGENVQRAPVRDIQRGFAE